MQALTSAAPSPQETISVRVDRLTRTRLRHLAAAADTTMGAVLCALVESAYLQLPGVRHEG